MASHYSVVQYLPDPRTGERINIGVVAFAEDEASARFLKNWERVSRFAPEDITFLKEFAKELETSVEDEDQIELEHFNGGALNEELVREIANGWKNSIQLTAPRGSLRSVSETLEFITEKFLRDPPKKQRNRGRRTAAKLTAGAVRTALEERLGSRGAQMLRRNYMVHGRHDDHSFDIAVVNGGPDLLAHAVSFEIKQTKSLDRLVDATLWAIDDVKTRDPEFPVGMAALPPREENNIFEHAREVVTGLGADFVVEDELPNWADQQVERLEQELA